MIGEPLSGDFAIEQVWEALLQQLSDDLGSDIDVDCIGEQDFDEDAMLTVQPPAARVVFLEEAAENLENQNLNYNVDSDFGVICADQDLGPDPQARRYGALRLVRRVKVSLIGARLELKDGTLSEPIKFLNTKPIPTRDLGMGYMPRFRVQGVGSYPGPNAVASGPGAYPTNSEGEDNA